MHASTVVVGDKLGLYRALADLGPTDAAALADATDCDARLVQEWLDAQYVSGYCHFSAQTGTYWLSPEQAAVLADPASPAFLVGSMTIAASTAKDEEKIREAFTTGKGLGWHEHHHDLFHGTERLFRPGYVANLVSQWIPALDGVADKLTRRAARSPISAAGTAPRRSCSPRPTRSRRSPGFDYHHASIDVARKRAVEAGVADRVHFEVASAQDFPGTGYDLVCIFDALHDMGDPLGAARHIRAALARRRDVAARRTDGRRVARRQREPRRADLLRRVDVHLHPRRAGPAGRVRPRRPGPRGHARRARDRRRLQPVPPRHGDPVQPDLRSPTVGVELLVGPPPHGAPQPEPPLRLLPEVGCGHSGRVGLYG